MPRDCGPHDLAEVLAGRAGPDGVRELLGGRTTRAALHRALLDALPAGSSVRLRLCRSKIAPGRKLSGYFEVTVGGPVPDRRRIAVAWTVPGAAPGEAEVSAAGEAHVAAPGEADTSARGPADISAPEATVSARGPAGPFARLRIDDPARGLRLLVAPLDPAFPQLARLHDPRYLRPRLGDADRVTAIRYRPGQRHVLRLDPVGLFVKLHAGDAERATVIGTGMARLLDGAPGRVPAPTLLPDDGAVAWPAAPGVPLSRWLVRDPRAVADRLPQVGALLRAIHDAPSERVPAAVPVGRPVDDELSAITHAARHIGILLPPVGARVAEILARGRDRLAALPVEPPRLVHGDFKADHVLVAPGRLTVIDLDRCAWSDPALDLAKFLADLRWWTRACGAAEIAALRAGFLAGYGGCPAERLTRLRLLEPLLLLKMAARRPRLHDPRWSAQTTALVDTAQRLAADRPVIGAVA